jgi:flagellin
MAAITGNRHLGITSRRQQESMGKLSSGMRIRSAADDAAGVAVATQFVARTRSQAQAQRNANDAIAMLQTAEGAYETVADIMTRMRELAVQAANDTLTDSDRGYIETEFGQLRSEIDRISEVTDFNNVGLLNAAQTLTYQVGADDSTDDRITIDLQVIDTNFLKVNASKVETVADAQAAITSIDEGLVELNEERALLGATMNQLQWAADGLGRAYENLTAALTQIRDVDIAQESAEFAGQTVLMNSGVAMLAQANQNPNLALRLLG